MAKIGKILTVVGILLTAVLVLAIMIFMFGAIIFVIVGEGEWFPRYVVLNGYYTIINVMFFLDYFAMSIGSLGIPMLIAGIVLSNIGKSKAKNAQAQQPQQSFQSYQNYQQPPQGYQNYQQNPQGYQDNQNYPPYQNR